MVEQALYETLENLAQKHIPRGTHRLLHINSREAWTSLMIDLVESGAIRTRLSMLAKCAVNWEALLIQKISIQN